MTLSGSDDEDKLEWEPLDRGTTGPQEHPDSPGVEEDAILAPSGSGGCNRLNAQTPAQDEEGQAQPPAISTEEWQQPASDYGSSEEVSEATHEEAASNFLNEKHRVLNYLTRSAYLFDSHI